MGTNKNDVILEILNRAVSYSNGAALAAGAIMAGVNAIADAIGAKRVTLEQVIEALELQTNVSEEVIKRNIAIIKADMGQ